MYGYPSGYGAVNPAVLTAAIQSTAAISSAAIQAHGERKAAEETSRAQRKAAKRRARAEAKAAEAAAAASVPTQSKPISPWIFVGALGLGLMAVIGIVASRKKPSAPSEALRV